MSNKRLKPKEMVAKSKNKVYLCSTPEHSLDSPSRDSDSICESESASPVPFLCTQDGAEREIDVVWNFYTPKSDTAKTQIKNTTPVSRRIKKIRSIAVEKPIPKRRTVKHSQKKTELVQELIELNQNLHEYFSKKPSVTTDANKPQSEEDIFSDTSDSSPRACKKGKNRCLRKNIFSSKFTKVEHENGLESDDSMNECLLKASQVVEEKILNVPSKVAKRTCFEPVMKSLKPGLNVNMDRDSMDAILHNIKLGSPSVNKIKKYDSHVLNNDSFDSLLGNLNDSALERLSQMPVKNEPNKNFSNSRDSWMLKELIVCDGSPSSKSFFGRYNSMPESPTVTDSKPSTSGMVLGRYSSMPFNKSDEKITVPGDSPIRCTPDEIEKKRKQAREKLLAKRLLPFTASQQSNPSTLLSQQKSVSKKTSFQLKVPSSKVNKSVEKKPQADVNIKLIIEKKRQEALMKLRKKQPQSKQS